jgi:hypothetical protein
MRRKSLSLQIRSPAKGRIGAVGGTRAFASSREESLFSSHSAPAVVPVPRGAGSRDWFQAKTPETETVSTM